MARIDTATLTNGAASGVRMAHPLTALIGGVLRWNDARVTRKALSGLTSRELDDIGLTRADIDAIAQGTYR